MILPDDSKPTIYWDEALGVYTSLNSIRKREKKENDFRLGKYEYEFLFLPANVFR